MIDLPDELTLDIDPSSLTIDDVEAVEEISGVSIDEVLSGATKKAKVLKALVFVTLRRKYPDITLEDIGKIRIAGTAINGPKPLDPTPASAS